jgi:hypothetical protein
MGKKSRTATVTGMEKVRAIADQINMILRYIPYVQTNHIFGLDGDEGPGPFEFTKRFLDLAPGAFPAYSMLSAFGQAAPQNLEFQRDGRVIPFPFHFLSNIQMNIRPKNYSWPQFYDYLIDMVSYSYSSRLAFRRYFTNRRGFPTWLNVIRTFSSERLNRTPYYVEIRKRLETDRPLRQFYEQETHEIPRFFVEKIRQDLGQFWEFLPDGALYHDPNAYLFSQQKVESCDTAADSDVA